MKYGITPAGAGKTCYSLGCVCTNEDHPRRCGENDMLTLTDYFRLGSPPQVRGKR